MWSLQLYLRLDEQCESWQLVPSPLIINFYLIRNPKKCLVVTLASLFKYVNLGN